jgi:hypothetical protein
MGVGYFVCPDHLRGNWQSVVEQSCGVTSLLDNRSLRDRCAAYPDLTFPEQTNPEESSDGVFFRRGSYQVRVGCTFTDLIQRYTFDFTYNRSEGNVVLARDIWAALQNAGANERFPDE